MSSRPTAREKLLEGMRASLRIRGFGNTSMKELLDAQGVSSGSMYHAFPGGKEELAAAAVREVGLHGAELISGVFVEKQSVGEGIAAIFDALKRELEQSKFSNGCPVGVPATEAVGLSSAIGDAARDVFAAWIAAYRDALIAESWSDDDATRFASVIVAAYEGSLAIARAMRDTAPIEQAAIHLITVLDSHHPESEPS